MIEKAIVAIAGANAPLTALIGNRIGPPPFPQGTAYPFIAFRTITGNENNTQAGGGSLIRERVQFDIYGATDESRIAVRDALRTAFNGYRGTIVGIRVATVVRMPGPALPDERSPGSEELIYRQTDDYVFQYAAS